VIPREAVPGGAEESQRWELILARREARALLLDDGFPADPFAR